jgi:hypothetical protein
MAVARQDARPTGSSQTRGTRGASLLELLAAVGITAVAAGLSGGALARLARATAVQAARVRVVTALLDARRRAYASESTVEVAGELGATSVTIRPADGIAETVALPAGTSITRFPASGHVRFFASGLADNGTVEVGSADETAAPERVVVNQRGLVR